MKSKDQILLEEAYNKINEEVMPNRNRKLTEMERLKIDGAVSKGLSQIISKLPRYEDEYHEVAILRYVGVAFRRYLQDLLDENLTD